LNQIKSLAPNEIFAYIFKMIQEQRREEAHLVGMRLPESCTSGTWSAPSKTGCACRINTIIIIWSRIGILTTAYDRTKS